MRSINLGRMLLGGLIAGVLMFVGDGVVHGVVLKQGWQHIHEALGRPPMTEAQVRAEIVKCRGTQFDPQIADKLLSSALLLALFPPSTSQQDAGVRASLAVIGGSTYRAAGSQISRGA